MTAADSQTTLSSEDHTLWVSDGFGGSHRFNAGDPDKTRRGRCCWKFILQPTMGRRSHEERLRSAGHDRVTMFLFSGGEIFRFSMMSTAGPHGRFRDFGPCATLCVYNDDRVVRPAKTVDNLFTRGIPRENGTVIVVTWKRHQLSGRCRHVAVIPVLTVDWSARK